MPEAGGFVRSWILNLCIVAFFPLSALAQEPAGDEDTSEVSAPDADQTEPAETGEGEGTPPSADEATGDSEETTEEVSAGDDEVVKEETPTEEFDTGELAEDSQNQEAIRDWEKNAQHQAERQIRRGYYMVGGGAAAVAAATYFGITGADASRRREDAAALCIDPADPSCDDAIAFSKEASTNYAIGAALGVAGVTLAAVGAHNIVVGRRVKAQVSVGPTSAMLLIEAKF
jgi:hypothetical protein